MCIGDTSYRIAGYLLVVGILFLISFVLLFFLPVVKRWKPKYAITVRILTISISAILIFYSIILRNLRTRDC